MSRLAARTCAVLAVGALGLVTAGCGGAASTGSASTPATSQSAEASVKNTSVTLTNNTGSPLTIAWSKGIGDATAGTVTVANGASTSSVNGGLSDAEAAVALMTTANGTLVGLAISNPAIGYPNARTCPDKNNGAPSNYTCTSSNDYSPLTNFSENEQQTLQLKTYDGTVVYTATVKREGDTDTNKVWTVTLT